VAGHQARERGIRSLDELLDGTEPHATFHDASLREVSIDYHARTLAVLFDLCVGDPDGELESERERSRTGVLELTGLIFWAQEPPDFAAAVENDRLTADGPLGEAPTETGRRLGRDVPADAWAAYPFFSDWNAFAYCAAARATFRWVA